VSFKCARPESIAPLGRPTIHVWSARAASDAREICLAMNLLDAGELQRIQRIRLQEARRLALTSHAVKRLVLASYLRRRPQSLRFVAGSFGKPMIRSAAGDPPDIHFNLSHSGNSILLAVSNHRPVGIDTEVWSPETSLADLGARVLSAAELGAAGELSPADAHRALMRTWVRKEAVLKAVGVGLQGDMTRLHVGLADAATARAVRIDDMAACRPGYVLLQDLDLAGPRFAAVALAVLGED